MRGSPDWTRTNNLPGAFAGFRSIRRRSRLTSPLAAGKGYLFASVRGCPPLSARFLTPAAVSVAVNVARPGGEPLTHLSPSYDAHRSLASTGLRRGLRTVCSGVRKGRMGHAHTRVRNRNRGHAKTMPGHHAQGNTS